MGWSRRLFVRGFIVIAGMVVVFLGYRLIPAITSSGQNSRPADLTASQGVESSFPRARTDSIKPQAPWPKDTTKDIRRRVSQLRKIVKRLNDTGKRAAEEKQRTTHDARTLYLNARKIQGEDDDNAESLLRQAIDTAPEYTPALSALADLLLNEDVDEARELSLRCLAVDERDSVCHRTLISSYTRDGLFEDAFPHVAYCLEVDPKNIDCLSSMSSLYLNQGQLDETKRMLTWMRRVDPDSMFTQLAEGGYAHAVGDRDAARDAFDHACNKGQPFACKMLKEL